MEVRPFKYFLTLLILILCLDLKAKEIKSEKLVCSVPLNLWFSSAYRNINDERDNHFHEFEDWQFKLLLKKTGWKIIDEKKFTNPVKKIGFRPLLRLFTNRYLIVYAEKIKE